jgi:hypothetical protein
MCKDTKTFGNNHIKNAKSANIRRSAWKINEKRLFLHSTIVRLCRNKWERNVRRDLAGANFRRNFAS